ncbi:MAG: hypothetical protein ACXWIP_16915 [Burkholderiales bacterium]
MLRIGVGGLTALLVVLLSACSWTPHASADRDAAAKMFVTHPDASSIYVYRSPFNYYDVDTLLYLNGRLVGSTSPSAYFRIDAVPGHHVLHGNGIDIGQIALDTRPGGIYIVALDVLAGQSYFRLVPEAIGEERIRACCALLERWAPGQRALVR